MDHQELRQTLVSLHAELERTDNVDPQTRAVLADVDHHIQVLLARPDSELTTQHHSLTARLREAVVSLEVSHPHLLPGIQRVLDAFNEMGI